jgi:galactonate dehydratase
MPKITSVETVHADEFGNLVWVLIHTDSGLVGLGETFRNPLATIAYIHETCAPYLLGKDPLQVEHHMHMLTNRVGNHFNGFPTRSIELRGNSAIDMALWDLAGKIIGVPVHQLLGGLSREKIRIYNTCASPGYNASARTGFNTELQDLPGKSAAPEKRGAYDDLQAQVYAPDELAMSLLDEGITAMKIWPFDRAALANNGHHISSEELKHGVSVVEKIRKAVGNRIDIMMEYHGLWHLPTALRIADALSDLDIYWHEDPISMQNFSDLAEYKRISKGRVCGSECLGTRQWYRETLKNQSIDIVHFDMCWIGGMTEGKRIASLAQSYDRPIAPHDCTGPVLLVSNIHLLMNASNALIAETVRSHYRGFYKSIVTTLPRIEEGFAHAMTGVGWGTELSDEFLSRPDVTRRASRIAN